MDIAQIFIVLSLITISVTIVVCSFYLISLIKELKIAVSKATAILDDTHQITGSIARPVSSFSEFLMGFKNGFHLFNSFFNQEDKEK